MLEAFRSPAAAPARTLHTIRADSLCWRAGAASLLFGSSPSSSLNGHSIGIVSNCWCLLSRLSAHRRRCPARDERDPLGDQLLQVMFNHFLALKGEKLTLGKMPHLLKTSKVQQGLPQARWLMVVNRMERVVSPHLHDPVGEISAWKHRTNSELQYWPGALQCCGCNHLYDIFILFSYYLTISQPHCSSAAQGKATKRKYLSHKRLERQCADFHPELSLPAWEQCPQCLRSLAPQHPQQSSSGTACSFSCTETFQWTDCFCSPHTVFFFACSTEQFLRHKRGYKTTAGLFYRKENWGTQSRLFFFFLIAQREAGLTRLMFEVYCFMAIFSTVLSKPKNDLMSRDADCSKQVHSSFSGWT